MNEPDAAAVTKTLMPDGNPQPEDCRGDILIVDDDLSALQTLGALLTREGYEVRSAPTGQTALTFAREDPPELVLLDIRLPDMDGFEVCGELKREPQTANIPVIFISALEETGDKIKGFTAGAVDYVTKPFQGGELLARVETHLALIRLRNKVESQNEQLTRAIQESKEAETKVRQAAEEWRTTFDSIRDMVSIHDRDYRILRVNQAFAAALGMDIKQIIGKKCCDVIHGTGCPPSACPHAQAMASGKPVTEEFLEPRLGKYLQVSASPILNDRNEVSGSVHIVKDVTERKRAEDALQKAHDELEERVKERTSDLAIAKEQLQKRLEEIEELKSRLEQENIDLREEIKLQFAHEEIVGESEGIRKILMQVEQVAGTEATVLIQGETGTGKEIFARTIHRLSGRKDKPLITVNCASLPPTLIESELFGREKGAYTGALTRMVGRFEIADGATIFLDEIGEIPPEIQSKLLRILEAGQFERLGSTKTIKVNVRIIAATNRDLAKEVEKGRFRSDLYYRLNVFPITIPPLRERPDDIPLLVWAFVRQFEKKMGKRIDAIPRKKMEALRRHPWPGNVRELRNAVEHAMIISSSKTLAVDTPQTESAGIAKGGHLQDMERQHIINVLERSGWRITGKGGAAEALGLKRTTLQSKMKKLGISRPTSA